MAEDYNRLFKFSDWFLKSNGDLKGRSIHGWHLAEDIVLPSGAFGGHGWMIIDTDQDTQVTTESYAGDNHIRIKTAGTPRTIVGPSGMEQINQGSVSVMVSGHLALDGMQGETYWMFNASSRYLEGWVDGTKRIEL